MRNNIESVNSVLFDTLEKLQNKEMDLQRAKAIVDVSGAIAKNASLQLQASKLSKGRIPVPKDFLEETKFLTIGNGNIVSQKNEFAKYLGFKDAATAVEEIGSWDFEQKFKEKFK